LKPASAKQKGRKLQQEVRDRILDLFQDLEEDDVRSTGMGQGGEDVQLSPAARVRMPYVIECKWVEKLNVYEAYQQATDHKGDYEPLLIMKKNRKPTLAVVQVDHLLSLIKNNYEMREFLLDLLAEEGEIYGCCELSRRKT